MSERTRDELLDELTAMTRARDRLEGMATRALGERGRLREALRRAEADLIAVARCEHQHGADGRRATCIAAIDRLHAALAGDTTTATGGDEHGNG